jgi:hypothetical protein
LLSNRSPALRDLSYTGPSVLGSYWLFDRLRLTPPPVESKTVRVTVKLCEDWTRSGRIDQRGWSSRSKSVTSNGFGFADPPAGQERLYALPPDCFAIAHLRSAILP